MNESILITDDDMHIGNVLEEILKGEGYRTLRAYSGTEALMILKNENPDLVLLDLMLPGLSGDELLPHIKNIPVIVVSAKTDINDKVNLLLAGASDYVTKTFNIQELLARIQVALRSKIRISQADELKFEDIRIDLTAHMTYVKDNELRLTKTEFAILKLLMQNPSQVIAKSVMLDRISEDTPDCMESSLKVHVSNLRKKLKEAGGKDYIEAVWGIGFKMHTEN